MACPNLCGAYMPPRAKTPSQIIAEVAAKHGLTVKEITSRNRTWRVSHPRQEAMYELYTRTKLSLPQVARKLGLTDHSTVMHGIRAHEARGGGA